MSLCKRELWFYSIEEEEQAILSPSVQAESGDPGADALVQTVAATEKNDRKSEEGKTFSLCSLQIQLLGLVFYWNSERQLQKQVRCLRAANS